MIRWLFSDQSLLLRIAIGVSIFATLAIVDYRKNGPAATRWREYAFLLTCVGVAIAYGIANDLVTSRISPEYFLFYKGVAERLPIAASEADANRFALDLQAARIGTLASWTAGVIAGALLLFTNSLGRWPRLTMRQLSRLMPILFVSAIVCGVAIGVIGYRGGLIRTSDDFATIVRNDEMRPYRLMAAYGAHLGGYVGAGAGLLASLIAISVWRRGLATRLQSRGVLSDIPAAGPPIAPRL